MSDRQQEVLNAIDATLSGYTDDDPISVDAMRWSPAEPTKSKRPFSVAVPVRNGAAAADQMYRTLRSASLEVVLDRHAMAPLRALHAAITEELERERRQCSLEATIPDETERAAYLDAANGNSATAVAAAQRGIQPETLKQFLAAGLTLSQLQMIAWSTADADAAIRFVTQAANQLDRQN